MLAYSQLLIARGLFFHAREMIREPCECEEERRETIHVRPSLPGDFAQSRVSHRDKASFGASGNGSRDIKKRGELRSASDRETFQGGNLLFYIVDDCLDRFDFLLRDALVGTRNFSLNDKKRFLRFAEDSRDTEFFCGAHSYESEKRIQFVKRAERFRQF